MEPEGVPKVDKIDEKNGVWKRSKNLEKKSPGSEALRRTNRGKHIIRATPPTHPQILTMVALIVFFLCDSYLPKDGAEDLPNCKKKCNDQIDAQSYDGKYMQNR